MAIFVDQNTKVIVQGLTGGQGRYLIEMSHYEAVPPNVQQQLTGAYKAGDDDA